MAGLVPFIRRGGNGLARTGAGFDDLFSMLDGFFDDSFMPGRALVRDTFKLDIVEKDTEYLVEAEMPGVRKDEIEINAENDNLCISVNHTEETSGAERNFVHKERRTSSMSRMVRLAGAKLEDITAKLEDGVLTVTIPKNAKSASSRSIEIE